MSRRKRPIFARRRSTAPPTKSIQVLKAVGVKRRTGFEPASWRGVVPILRTGRYHIDGRPVAGDAPKDFIWVYRYTEGAARAADWRTWPAYIAKVGHQYYPGESATEQLMTRIGQICGLCMADSTLMLCAQQVRFLSRYFLREEEILNHGAEILGGYLADKEFVDGVAVQGAEKDLFTFQVFCTAIQTRFPDTYPQLLRGFVRMIGFDALVGNQDRHFYNWGVITHATAAVPPRFAPIYDTARGLFWNTTESQLAKYAQPDALQAYVRRSKPQIGWDRWREKDGELNHFELVRRIAEWDVAYRAWLKELANAGSAAIDACDGMIDAEFKCLLSVARRDLIKRCLRHRFQIFAKIF